MSYPRRTPVHAALESLAPEWGERFDMTVALRFSDAEEELKRLADLGLADLSALRRVGVKDFASVDPKRANPIIRKARGMTKAPRLTKDLNRHRKNKKNSTTIQTLEERIS